MESAEAVSLTFRDPWLICVMLAARPDAIASPAASSEALVIRYPDEICENARESAFWERVELNTDDELNPTAVRPLDIQYVSRAPQNTGYPDLGIGALAVRPYSGERNSRKIVTTSDVRSRPRVNAYEMRVEDVCW